MQIEFSLSLENALFFFEEKMPILYLENQKIND